MEKRKTEYLKSKIPFNKPYLTGKELSYIRRIVSSGWLSGDGEFTKKCQSWIQQNIGCKKALLVHSGSTALEMMAILSNVSFGDEVIMPSYTFVTTANAFVLRGATPVFVDIREDTLNIDETLIEKAITKKTKAIVAVHYAGVGCEMDKINKIASKYNLLVLEDAAQGLLSKYKGVPLGALGDMAAISFHETKNVISGEGGAILINNPKFIKRAEIIREKGTNRTEFFKGRVDKYSWVDIGSSYLPGEIIAAFLMAQLESARKITNKRLEIWQRYHKGLEDLERNGLIRRPIIPQGCQHNAHIYFILTRNFVERDRLLVYLKKRGILALSHYVPLHSSTGGRKYSRSVGSMRVTNNVWKRLLRLPIYYDLKKDEQDLIIKSIKNFYRKIG